MSGVTGRHHVPRVEHLLGELRNGERPEQKCFVKLTFHDNFDCETRTNTSQKQHRNVPWSYLKYLQYFDMLEIFATEFYLTTEDYK